MIGKQQKGVLEMISKGSKKGSVRFSIKPANGVKQVKLAGDFNEWKPAAMTRQKDGSFVKLVNVPPGTYEYKFVIDSEWTIDPDNNTWAVNKYGTLNSVAEVI